MYCGLAVRPLAIAVCVYEFAIEMGIGMNYREAREYIDTIQARLGSDYSLKEVTELAGRMGNPEKDLRIIHIAGTNGKGSVGNFIAHILAESGYTVGHYLSPTIVSYRERVRRLSGAVHPEEELITREDTARLLTKLREVCGEMIEDGYHQPTAFEIETVMALEMFVEWKVDFVILECGLGGRCDATNYIGSPLLCVFTSISRDHMSFLGDTLDEIAKEKYGIIKEKTMVVSAAQRECVELLRNVCHEKQATLCLLTEEASDAGCNERETALRDEADVPGEMALRDEANVPVETARCHVQENESAFIYDGENYCLSQRGMYQISNARLALEAVSQLQAMGFSGITYETKRRGLQNSRWKGRFELLSEEPFLLLDGAHNTDAMDKLCQSLEQYYPQEKFQFVIGVFRDKEYKRMVERILPLAERVFTVTAPGERRLSSEELAQAVREQIAAFGDGREESFGLKHGKEPVFGELPVCDCGTVAKALTKAFSSGKKTVVCGSFSLQRDVYSFLSEH